MGSFNLKKEAQTEPAKIVNPEVFYRLIRCGMLHKIEKIHVIGDKVVHREHDVETLIGSCSSRMALMAEEDVSGVKWKT